MMEALTKIQAELKAPKNHRNSFGNYSYRSCEDILEAVKPLLVKHGVSLVITDDVREIGGRVYVVATATIKSGSEIEYARAFAREADDKKGMDVAQITGAASSYARKYALNGLFLIDDTKDADATNQHGNESRDIIAEIQACNNEASLMKLWNSLSTNEQNACKAEFTSRRNAINGN